MKPSANGIPRVARAALGAAWLAGAALLATACVVYEPVPAYQPSGFDRSWAAAIGAMQDQGVTITEQDRAAGIVRGTRGAVTATATVLTQADGRVRVEFNTTGAKGADPGLAERISASYGRRMGR